MKASDLAKLEDVVDFALKVKKTDKTNFQDFCFDLINKKECGFLPYKTLIEYDVEVGNYAEILMLCDMIYKNKDDFKNILKERNIEIYRDDSHGSYGSSIWGEDIHAFFDTDGNLKDIVISGKVESPMGLRVGDSIEKVYELYGKEHQFHDEPGGTVLHYVFPSNIFFISINEDKVVTGMGMKVSVNPNEIETYEVENSDGSSMSGGAGSAIPEPGMRNLELIQGSYFKDIEGKQGKLEILGASPMGINFKFEIENNVELQGSADFIDGTDPKYASNFFTRAVYENGLIYFEKLDNGNIKITYSHKPEYSGEWIKE